MSVSEAPKLANTPHSEPLSPQVSLSQALEADTDSNPQVEEEEVEEEHSPTMDDEPEFLESADPRAIHSQASSEAEEEEQEDPEDQEDPPFPASQVVHGTRYARAESLEDFDLSSSQTILLQPVTQHPFEQSVQQVVKRVFEEAPKKPKKLTPEDMVSWSLEANNLAIPELFKWISQRTGFTYDKATTQVVRQRKGLASLGLLPAPEQAAPFYGLSSSTGISQAYEETAKTFGAFKEPYIQSLIGKFQAPKDLLQVHMSSFKLSDTRFRWKRSSHLRIIMTFVPHLRVISKPLSMNVTWSVWKRTRGRV